MHGDSHVGRDIRHRRIDEIAVNLAESPGIVAAIDHLLAIFRIAQHGNEDFIKLEIAAPGIGEGAHRPAVSLAQVGEKLVEPGIHALVDRGLQRPAVDRGGCRYRNFRHARGVRLHEFEMLDHRMAGKSKLAGDAHPLVTSSNAGKCNAGIHDMTLGAIETPKKIEVPPGAAKLAISYGLKPHLLLFLDDSFNLPVLGRLEIRSAHLAVRTFPTRRLHRRRAQQTSDVIGTERRLGSLHESSPLAVVVSATSLARSTPMKTESRTTYRDRVDRGRESAPLSRQRSSASLAAP